MSRRGRVAAVAGLALGALVAGGPGLAPPTAAPSGDPTPPATAGAPGPPAAGLAAPASAAAVQGFGTATRGGAGSPVYRVTTLADAGPGSLREALALGSRYVVFDVAGEIRLASPLVVGGPFVTIDGFTAPPPGITLRGYGLVIRHHEPARIGRKAARDGGRRAGGAHDVVVRGLRVRDATGGQATDCIQIAAGTHDVVIDHVSVQGCADGAIDITGGVRDVTVAWSILAEPRSGKTMLITDDTSRVTLHHNLFVRGQRRNPTVTRVGSPRTTELTLDMRNNVIWNWGGGYGTLARYGARANVVDNLYGNPTGGAQDRKQALVVCPGAAVPAEFHALCGRGDAASAARAYAKGNVSLDGVDLDAAGTEGAPFPAPRVDTTDACAAAREVLARAGVRPLDELDRGYVASVALARCPGS